MRPGDRLIKQQVEYKEPGSGGENALWDFSGQKSVNEHYELKYYGYQDSLTIGQEHRTLYKYILRGDSLLWGGFENQTTTNYNLKPELLLVYPVSYGSGWEDYFHGNGDYCGNLFITSQGKTSVKADAWGRLILPGATRSARCSAPGKLN